MLPKPPDLNADIDKIPGPDRRVSLKTLAWVAFFMASLAGIFIPLYISSAKSGKADCAAQHIQDRKDFDTLQKKYDLSQAKNDLLQSKLSLADSLLWTAVAGTLKSLDGRKQTSKTIITKSTQ